MLFSPSLPPQSRVLMYRRISERVRRIAPFLTYDSDPYLAISEGRLVWIQDAYTTSTRYPYSTPSAGRHQLHPQFGEGDDRRLSRHGALSPRRYRRSGRGHAGACLPDLFKPLSEMPEDLRTRLRYPQGIFSLQAAMFATFHMTNPATFYNREDQWEIPSLELGEGAQARR